MADRLADPVIGWHAIARHLTRARCALARLAVTPPPRQLVVEPDTARMAVVRNPAIVRLRWSGRLGGLRRAHLTRQLVYG